MLALEHQLSNFIDTLNLGPDALDPALFSGPIDRVLLGLKAHANTISHARLIALEHSFPLTREAMGDARFNALSRQFCECAVARRSDSNRIGAGFAAFLDGQGTGASLIDLAHIEWAWIESYDAADAPPLTLNDLSGLDVAAVLALRITLHPAVRLVKARAPLSPLLADLGSDAETAAVMITRPDADVFLHALNAQTMHVARAAQKSTFISNLLSASIEQQGEAASLEPVLTLINAGALTSAATAAHGAYDAAHS
jgi:hypothetical protein